jgi:hypothetical protein
MKPRRLGTTASIELIHATRSILRKTAARTIPSLWNAIRDALLHFTPEQCGNFFTAAGYEPE